MTLLERIQKKIESLPRDKQYKVLDYVTSLQQSAVDPDQLGRPRSLRQHQAFGSWKARGIDGLKYEQDLRAEWDHPA